MSKTDRALLALAAIAATWLVAAAPAAAQTQTQGTQTQGQGQSGIQGLKLSGDQPIQIESDQLEVRENEHIAIFSGNVSVTQGATLLKSGKLTVHYAPDSGSATTGTAQIERLEVDGTVYVKSDDQIATGDRGTFDMKTEQLTLTGQKVVLTQDKNVLTGCKLTYDMKSGLANFEPCKGGRVITLIDPKTQKPPQSQ